MIATKWVEVEDGGHLCKFSTNSLPCGSDTVSPHILYDFYMGNEAAREAAELKEAAR